LYFHLGLSLTSSNQGYVLDAHNKILKILTQDIARINRGFALLKQYQIILRRKIHASLRGKQYVKKRLKGLSQNTHRLTRISGKHVRQMKKLWRSNDRLWKRVWHIRQQMRTHAVSFTIDIVRLMMM
jgi:hypothetical protein